MTQNSNNIIENVTNVQSMGLLDNGVECKKYQLKNSNGMEMWVMDYGATITNLIVKGGTGNLVDVVLGFDTIKDYVQSFSLPNATYFGAVVGRCAGRINNGTFTLNGSTIQLTQNHGMHQIHGGYKGFSTAIWKVLDYYTGKNPSIKLQYISPDGEEGYPGELITEVIYTLTESNEVNVTFSAQATKDTLVNLTQHSYFNLAGHKESVLNQDVQIFAEERLEIESDGIPTGKLLSVETYPALNFRTKKKCPKEIDTTFVLTQSKAAELSCTSTLLKMTVFTNQPGVHIYVGGNCFNQIEGKEKATYTPTSGICFETQYYPDAVNNINFPSPILLKGTKYHHKTTFKFETL